MTAPIRRLAVYCGSASPENPRYEELAMEIGHELAARDLGVSRMTLYRLMAKHAIAP